MPSRRSPGSSCARRTPRNTGTTTSARCPPTFMVRAIISISILPRPPRAAAQSPRGKAAGRFQCRRLGHRHPAPGVPLRGRSGQRVPLPPRKLQISRNRECRFWSDVTIRELAETICEIVGYRGSSISMPRSRMELRASSWTRPNSRRWDGSPAPPCATGSARRTSGIWIRRSPDAGATRAGASWSSGRDFAAKGKEFCDIRGSPDSASDMVG